MPPAAGNVSVQARRLLLQGCMSAPQKVIVLPPELAAKAHELDANGFKKNLNTLLAEHHRPQLLQALAERSARPKPFTLLRFFEQQGETLLGELTDGVTHFELYLRYTASPNSPVKCSYARFSVKLAEFRRLKGLPSRYKTHAESVTDLPSQLGDAAPTTPPAMAASPLEPARRRRRRGGHDWNPLGS